MPNTRTKTLNGPLFPSNQASLADEDGHEVNPPVAEINVPRLLGNQHCDPEEAHERGSLLEPHPRLMTEP